MNGFEKVQSWLSDNIATPIKNWQEEREFQEKIDSTQLGLKDPQKTYMWEVSISNATGSSVDRMTFYAKQTAIPPVVTENIKRWYAGVEYHYSGRDVSPRIFRVTFYDNTELEVLKFFRKWSQLSNSGEINRKSPPKAYMGNASIRLLKNTGKSANDYSFYQVGKAIDDAGDDENVIKLYDVYPTEISEVVLSYSESGEITFDVMFSFSRQEMKTE